MLNTQYGVEGTRKDCTIAQYLHALVAYLNGSAALCHYFVPKKFVKKTVMKYNVFSCCLM